MVTEIGTKSENVHGQVNKRSQNLSRLLANNPSLKNSIFRDVRKKVHVPR